LVTCKMARRGLVNNRGRTVTRDTATARAIEKAKKRKRLWTKMRNELKSLAIVMQMQREVEARRLIEAAKEEEVRAVSMALLRGDIKAPSAHDHRVHHKHHKMLSKVAEKAKQKAQKGHASDQEKHLAMSAGIYGGAPVKFTAKKHGRHKSPRKGAHSEDEVGDEKEAKEENEGKEAEGTELRADFAEEKGGNSEDNDSDDDEKEDQYDDERGLAALAASKIVMDRARRKMIKKLKKRRAKEEAKRFAEEQQQKEFLQKQKEAEAEEQQAKAAAAKAAEAAAVEAKASERAAKAAAAEEARKVMNTKHNEALNNVPDILRTDRFVGNKNKVTLKSTAKMVGRLNRGKKVTGKKGKTKGKGASEEKTGVAADEDWEDVEDDATAAMLVEEDAARGSDRGAAGVRAQDGASIEDASTVLNVPWSKTSETQAAEKAPARAEAEMGPAKAKAKLKGAAAIIGRGKGLKLKGASSSRTARGAGVVIRGQTKKGTRGGDMKF